MYNWEMFALPSFIAFAVRVSLGSGLLWVDKSPLVIDQKVCSSDGASLLLLLVRVVVCEMTAMESVDLEFGPVRRSKTKVDADQIIHDVSVDHEQTALLRKISLIPIKRPLDADEPARNVRQRAQSGARTTISDVESLDSEYQRFRQHLLRQLHHTLPARSTRILPYLRGTLAEIDRILKQAILQKESHAAILVGPRQSYKSFLLRHEIELLTENYLEQFITIKLDGFLHSENNAINAIAAQLEGQLEKIHQKKDTKPDQTAIDVSSGSLTEVFEKILRLLDSVSTEGKHSDGNSKITVVFIFNEIDTFAGPVRQTLLYNLFDMVEHARVPVCIFGSTTKLNFLEYLEKRVKSRFSQRVIYMPQFNGLADFVTATAELLKVDSTDYPQFVSQWNDKVAKCLSDQNSELYQLIKANFDTCQSISALRNSIIPMVFKCRTFESLCDSLLSCESIRAYNGNQLENSLLERVKSLSSLELAILVCAGRASLKTKDETVNFNLAYAEYENMIKTLNARIPTVVPTLGTNGESTITIDNIIKTWAKKDVKNVWESLISLDLLTEKSAVGIRETAIAAFYASNYHLSGTTIPFDLRIYHMQVTLDELRRIVPRTSMYYPWTQL